MEEDKFEEKIAENKPTTDKVYNKLNKLDSSPNPEIKTKKRVKSTGMDTTAATSQSETTDNTNQKGNTDNNQDNANERLEKENSFDKETSNIKEKKEIKPRKIKITKL